MKSLNTLTAIAIAASLVVGVTGCKKTPKNVTNIPRAGERPIQDDPGRVNLPPGSRGPGTSGTLTDGPGTTGAGVDSKPLTQEQLDALAGQGTRHDPSNFNEDASTLAAETVLFDYDRSTVKSSEVPKVQRVATYLKNQPSAMLRVEGNCDERGTEEYNRSLGERRALAVRELLLASGIGPDRVSTVTYGEDKPADPGHDEAAWTKNRRADFVVLNPKTTQ